MAAVREARVVWQGDITGKGSVTAASSGAFRDLSVTFAARTQSPDGKTSPEELIAAAHASCFAMALSFGLGQAGHAPERLEVTAKVTFSPVAGGGFEVKSSALTVHGKVPGLDAAAFKTAAEGAKENCPVSKALKGNVTLSLETSFG